MALSPSLTTRRLVALAAAGLAVAGTLVVTSAASADASTTTRTAAAAPQPPAKPGSTYLALGDSVSFGYREANSEPTPDYTDASNFAGFPEMVASALNLKLTNAACPGETSASFVDDTQQSNGCESAPGGGPGYRTAYPLHTSYNGSQLQYAVKFLKANPDTRLVTLMVGANDYFLCQETTPDNCASTNEQLAVIGTVTKNVKTIVNRIRNKAGYAGQFVIVNYYSTDYTDTTLSQQTQLLNTAISGTVKSLGQGVKFAGGFSAMKNAAANAEGSTCDAGLLTYTTQPTPTSAPQCGVHPSVAGHAVLAGAVEKVVKK